MNENDILDGFDNIRYDFICEAANSTNRLSNKRRRYKKRLLTAVLLTLIAIVSIAAYVLLFRIAN